MTGRPRGLLNRALEVRYLFRRQSRLCEVRHLQEAPIGATRSFTAGYTGPFRPGDSQCESSPPAAAGRMIHLCKIHGWVRESDRLLLGGPGGKSISLTYRKVHLAKRSDVAGLHQDLGYDPPPYTYAD